MEEDANSVQFESGQLFCVGMGLESLPDDIVERYANETIRLDLTGNNFTQFPDLSKFPKLQTLVMDDNKIVEVKLDDMTPVTTVETLWINGNLLSDLDAFCEQLVKAFPNLTYLSMLKNPACPNYFTGKDQEDYDRYRLFVLWRIPTLKFLDSQSCATKEKADAQRVGKYMKVIRVKPQEVSSPGKAKQAAPSTTPDEAAEDKVGMHSSRFGVLRYVREDDDGNNEI